jgi:NAD+ synthetase
VLAGPLEGVAGLTEENLQARIRGATLMAFSNKTGALLLTTGNKSELAVGYCTLYGDMCGGLAVISDVPKTDVYRLAHEINAAWGREVIPLNTITKPPSAELAPDQKDEDSLPPYDVLDAILQRYVELDEGPERIISAGFEPATVRRIITLVDRSEYKRRQAAMGLKVTSRAFGVGRRMPIAQGFDHGHSSHGEPAPAFPKNSP